MKLLENKYIDLANFYKNLMLKEQEFSQRILGKGTTAYEKGLTQ
jgi:hypothetical protein